MVASPSPQVRRDLREPLAGPRQGGPSDLRGDAFVPTALLLAAIAGLIVPRWHIRRRWLRRRAATPRSSSRSTSPVRCAQPTYRRMAYRPRKLPRTRSSPISPAAPSSGWSRSQARRSFSSRRTTTTATTPPSTNNGGPDRNRRRCARRGRRAGPGEPRHRAEQGETHLRRTAPEPVCSASTCPTSWSCSPTARPTPVSTRSLPRQAADRGVRVFTIGFGTTTPTPLACTSARSSVAKRSDRRAAASPSADSPAGGTATTSRSTSTPSAPSPTRRVVPTPAPPAPVNSTAPAGELPRRIVTVKQVHEFTVDLVGLSTLW